MLTTLIAFLIVLGILIFIHELGHFLAARHVGVRVEAFSVGFPPTLWGKKIGDTEYRISWIPVGGYVKLFGQNVIDEDPDDPTNYASKTLFQRLYILIAGPLMNLLFALIFMPLVFWIGMNTPAYLDDSPRIKDVQDGSYSQQLGIQANDEIIAVNQSNGALRYIRQDVTWGFEDRFSVYNGKLFFTGGYQFVVFDPEIGEVLYNEDLSHQFKTIRSRIVFDPLRPVMYFHNGKEAFCVKIPKLE